MPASTHRLAAVLVTAGAVVAAGSLTSCTDPMPATPSGQQTATVLRVVNGDTLSVRTQTSTLLTVRLIGVRLAIGCWEKQAAAMTATLAGSGTTVTLDPDPTLGTTDRRGRTLAYVGLPARHDMLNEHLLREGATREFDYDNQPYRHRPEFIAAETTAKTAHKGLWQACPPTTPSTPGGHPT